MHQTGSSADIKMQNEQAESTLQSSSSSRFPQTPEVSSDDRTINDKNINPKSQLAVPPRTPSRKSRSKSPTYRHSAKVSPRRSNSVKSVTSRRKQRSSSERKEVAKGEKRTGHIERIINKERKKLRIVDMSGLGLSDLPGSVFQEIETGELFATDNNMRTLSPEIVMLKYLVKLDLTRNPIRGRAREAVAEGPDIDEDRDTRSRESSRRSAVARKLGLSSRVKYSTEFPNLGDDGLPMELLELRCLETLILAECNLLKVPRVVWKLRRLKRLDLSRNRIQLLPKEVGNLEKLDTLNLKSCGLATLPIEIGFCQRLRKLILLGNEIDQLPASLRELPKLRHLELNVRIFASTVPDYKNNLLKSGQIQSDHIPPVIFELPALEGLDLAHAKMNNIPKRPLRSVKWLHVNNNFFQDVPEGITVMTRLVELDMSKNNIENLPEKWPSETLQILRLQWNHIKKIPEAVCTLNSLRCLELDHNRLHSIPGTISKLQNLRKLTISYNGLRYIPEALCDLSNLQTLDLSHNKIKELPINFHKLTSIQKCHEYRGLDKCGLWLTKNPLEIPPPDIWQSCDPNKISDYLKELAISRVKTVQRQKLIFLGDERVGKTTLIRSIMQQTTMNPLQSSSTNILEIHKWHTKNNRQFLIIDTSGKPDTRFVLDLFIDINAVAVIVFDENTIEENHNQITMWMNYLQSRTPGISTIIIGITKKADPTGESDKKILTKNNLNHDINIKEIISNQLRKYDLDINDNNVQTKGEEIPRKIQILNLENIIEITFTTDMVYGIDDFVNFFEISAIDKSVNPDAHRETPLEYGFFKKLIKDHQKENFLYLDLHTFRKSMRKNDVTPEDLNDCLHHMKSIGEILWFPNDRNLNKIIFHKPAILITLLRCLFRTDYDDHLDYYGENRVLRTIRNLTLDEMQYSEAQMRLLKRGEFSQPMLEMLWFYLRDALKHLQKVITGLEKLQLLYQVPKPEDEREKISYTSYPLITIPWIGRKNSEILDITNENIRADFGFDEEMKYSLKKDIYLSPKVIFGESTGHGIFERACVILNNALNIRLDYASELIGKSDEFILHVKKLENGHISIEVWTDEMEYTRVSLESIVKIIESNIKHWYPGVRIECK